MDTIKSSLTIIFEPPFYKAIFERSWDSVYEVGQLILGPAEPKTCDIYRLVNTFWTKIHFFANN
ncbi:MAG: DUF2992 family protein [Liquorilactobacillus nagelii]|jgi:hypothetical protein|uniref:Uncharacterized protein n=1 Tax=Liquorilactobacillus nagelii TaxID=82688 RepID=A0A3Q8CMZ1_9LACO|nr:DUF2992 family protein [Liquorilactobacillus nagelii]AUJ32920.1 hypothetical protein BSQ50_10445 [Liquorilactobacillus nagelii]MCC7616332.1 DUF2992 domain-containing protein [Liquorilactobacillus nagelii]MCI1920931.1 YjdF family protein [Liquorilactobacillus nagelii]MCI1976585.1 YjdF family protein [Liquorilactobacillus nagelii]MCP9315093.1 DUF2992 family protein [Liquorilactobacillus nagelii]